MYTWIKFKNDMKAGMTPYKVCKDMQKKVKQSNTTSIFPEYFIFFSPIQPMSFDYPDNFQLAAPISFQSTPTQIFSRSLLINPHTTMFNVLGYPKSIFQIWS